MDVNNHKCTGFKNLLLAIYFRAILHVSVSS